MSGIIAQNTLDNSGLIKAPAGGGAWNFIKKLTASASGDLSFVDGTSDVVLDSTYKEYLFTFNNIHPATDNVQFMHNGSIDTGSNYNVVKTNTVFEAEYGEGGGGGTLGYISTHDIAQGTGNAKFTYNCGNDNDQSVSGYMQLFSPSSTVFVKHFLTVVSNSHNSDMIKNTYTGGYYNTTSALDAMQFTFSSGNIDLGDICLYGLTT